MNKLFKNVVLFSILVLQFYTSSAQDGVKIPERSPRCHVVQEIGLSTVTIDYSRPSMRNRLIFGDLVPFDRMWKTGENEATTIEFSDDVLIEGEYLPKGKYALYTMPGEEVWSVIFYKDWDQFGLPKRYMESQEALAVEVESEELAMTFETLLINIDKIRDSSAVLQLIWEDVLVEVKMSFDTKTKVMDNISKVLAGPSRSDYYLAAKYYYEKHIDLDKALEWVNEANSKGEKYWQYLLKGQILKSLGEEEEAIAAAEKALAQAKEAGNRRYVRLATQLLDSFEEEEVSPNSQEQQAPTKKGSTGNTREKNNASHVKGRRPLSPPDATDSIPSHSPSKMKRRRVIEYRKERG